MANFLSRFIDKSSEPSPSKGVEPETLTPEVDSEAVASQEAEASLDPQAPPPKKIPALAIAKSTWRWINRGKPIYRRPLFWATLVIGGGAIATGRAIYQFEQALPDPSAVLTFVRDETLTILAADNSILQQRGPATREKLPIEKIPQVIQDAFIASEDRRFYQHDGVDYRAIVRATLANLSARVVAEGGSTITQQLARVVFLSPERSLTRKLREARIAQKIEEELSKEQILERYLNLVYLGSGAYGVADAAWVYFSKTVDQLTLPEVATIAGLPPAPSNYSPLENPDIALQRRNIVLRRMEEVGQITPQESTAAQAAPLGLNPSPPKRFDVKAPYFTSYVEQQLPKLVPPEELAVGGLTVETTLNMRWQAIAEKAVKNAIEIDGPAQGFEQAALVAVDPRNGQIKAMVGGQDFNQNQFNRVTQAQRQPGSTFKTFVYTAAIAAGFSPYDGYLDSPYTVDGYKPENYGKTFRGWVSMDNALTASINIVAVKVLIDVGFEPAIRMAKEMGIVSELKPYYTLALGALEVNLLELTNAYGTLAAKGKFNEAHGIRRVLNRRGEVIFDGKYKARQAVDPNSAAIMTWMLEGVVKSGTGRPAYLSDRSVAGKTGTSEQARDLWFVGYIPQLVTGVWLGNDDNYPTWGSSGTAAFTWGEFMSEVAKDIPAEKFPDLPTLEGRKGSIKAQPVTPRQVIVGPIPAPNTGSQNSSGGNSYSEPEPAYQEPYYEEPYYNDQW
ncbi:penicillin-binding protein 1A [Desertifilum sp. FACHB-1129]|uniref:Penicillin-binding protein n=1 Tax=Desertifilum tharense IPPAS B-1220 TaxID=1781255 RepID=A0A1E5QFT0_9CYAN|nr:penicillin-binding protein 1A [Desertifilum tharense]MBD2310348.1 penicillin-binding protein 1A [Desertifilum sp. FACHB-1129]MBD2321799.1 penicillin-binding protein 1A [Desertifilum sp. FACHB-866]MBD2331926.1 penicillin-binding protein 1A [Desertifilum sp. FACHB-868]OEJ73478.1 penicillin-binding protein [Desertifilum tharense IPPAS B-1220]